MKKKNLKKIISLSFSLIILSTIVVYTSYSYYISETIGNESISTVGVAGGSVIVKYQSNSSNITASGIYPGWSTSKYFTISYSVNASNMSATPVILYDVLLTVDRNDFLTGSLQYKLVPYDIAQSKKAGIYSNNSYYNISNGSNTSGIKIGSGSLMDKAESHKYNLSIRYIEQTNVDQYSENNAVFNARVNINSTAVSNYSTLSVDLDGGTGITLSDQNKTIVPTNKSITFPSPTKSGYKFYGWEITDGSGTIDGNQISVTSENASIKALYHIVYFDFDSWSTIASNIKSGNTSRYSVGDEKEVAINGTNYTVRVANNSNYDCTLDSKTACGFVVEFVDIVQQTRMNSSATSVGGWPATGMYKYLNGDTSDHLTYNGTNETLYSKLPSDLRNAIIDTTVVSGHGPSDSNSERDDGNWVSTDKIYLLSTKEVWVNGSSNAVSSRDTAYNNTRQLDFYSTNKVTTSNFGGAAKIYNGTSAWWWLRAARSDFNDNFFYVSSDGDWYGHSAHTTGGGLAPAFRIG